MDAHYDQVMKAREAASGTQTRKYFGYSTVLDRAAFEEWRQQHGYEFFILPPGELVKALDLALVYDFPSRWWGGRVAGISAQAGSHLYGRLFEIPEKDWPIIQHKEGAVTGMCVEVPVRVELNGKVIDATAFATKPERRSSDGAISARFVEAFVRGARTAGLPEEYVRSLETGAR